MAGNASIRRKLTTMLLLTSGVALLLTSATFLVYEVVAFRQRAVEEVSTLGRIVASNSTAALAFDNRDDAREILSALRADPRIVGATLYDRAGKPFAHYPSDTVSTDSAPAADGYRFAGSRLVGFEPVVEGQNSRLGTLSLTVSMASLYRRLELYAGIAGLVFALALAASYLLARLLQQQITTPILALAEMATAVSERGDYSVRAQPREGDELGVLTGAFNHMLAQIEAQNRELEQRGEALRASEQSLATTLDSIADAVIATDTAGRLVRMNPVAGHLTGWEVDDAVGRPLADVFRSVDEVSRQPVTDAVERILREPGGLGPIGRTVLLARDGSERPIATSGAPIRDHQGQVRGVVLVFRDQTEERRTEEMRVKSVQLEAQNRHVQEASRLKSEFLANMSHELRTPLNGILGFAEILYDERAGPLSADQKEHLGDILTSGRHLLQLINDVLDLSKVEAGKLEFRPERIDLPRLIGEVMGVLRTTIAARAIHVSTEVAPELTDVVLDASRLKQVLYNYVSNAIKFTSDDGHVTVRARPASADTFRLEVEDTGTGIAPEDLGRLFVEFEQLDAGAAKRHGGTGLGLALTKRLVEAQGGRVGAQSTVGKGSVFFAVLPRHAATAAVEAAAPRAVGAQPGAAAPTILVVEDDRRDQHALVDALAGAGYAVDAAASGTEALAKCRDRVYDAITLDLLLPDMSGLDVLRAVRSESLNRDVPIIVVTVVTERGAVAGFAVHDILGKPLDGTALLDSLHRARVTPERSGGVLVVDDDGASCRLMAATLAQLGYRAVTASGGEAGLRLAQQTPPTAVVLDLLMPGMDGFEFLDRLRALPACRTVPVIVWTVMDLTAEEYSRLRRSAQEVVAKGLGGASVVEALERLLPRAREGAADGG